jgi:hypothetical protein
MFIRFFKRIAVITEPTLPVVLVVMEISATIKDVISKVMFLTHN